MAQENNSIDIKKLLLKVLKNWYWFFISGIIVGALCLLYYFSTTPKYQIEAAIMLRQENGKANTAGSGAIAALGALSDLGLGGNKSIDDEIAIIRSRGLMRQAVVEMGLQNTYRIKKGLRWVVEYPTPSLAVEYPATFCDTLEQGFKIDVKATKNGYTVKVKQGLFKHSKHHVTDLNEPIETCVGEVKLVPNRMIHPGERFRIITAAQLPAIDKCRENIQITKKKKDSSIILFATVSECPRRDIALINKLIELYNMNAILDKNILATKTAQFIDERLVLITSELNSAEQDVEAYKKENNIADITLDAKRFVEGSTLYQTQLAEVETQINLVDYIQDFLSKDSNRYSLIPANIGIEDNALIALITEYNTLLLSRMKMQRTATDSNPVVVQLNEQLNTMRDNINASIASARQSLVITRDGLKAKDNEFNDRIQAVPTQERQYVEIERRRLIKEQLYLFLFQKREENALMLASTSTPAKVIDIPQRSARPISPRLRYLAIITLIIGAGLPLGIIYLLLMFRSKIESLDEYEKLINAPLAGQIILNSRGKHIAISDGENTVSAELFRLLRTNIKFMLPTKGAAVILVTSSINGEGKSYIATNTALSLALLGKKVALVGLDIRKPMLAQYFGLVGKGCLTSYLADDSYTLDDITIKGVENANLDLIPAGAIPPNPSELLQEGRLDTLFEQLRARYDYIIVDTAPVALVSDTFLLGRVADMTLYVSRADYTPTQMIQFLNHTIEQKRLKNIACVLNGVSAKKAGYGYGYGYGTTQD